MASDLISREAAIYAMYYKPSYKMAIEVLKEVPAVDAVPVVRCRDCKFYYGVNEECGCNGGYHSEDWYCADGERRDGGEADE